MTIAAPPPLVTEDPVAMFGSDADPGDVNAVRLASVMRSHSEAYRESLIGNAPPEEVVADVRQKHNAYWRYCTVARCPQEGHRLRHNWVMVGPSRKSFGGDQQCDIYRKAYHAESLEEEYGAYEQVNLDWHEGKGLRSGEFDPLHPDGVLETLLLAGGVHEIPIRQFLTLRMHQNPIHLAARPDVRAYLEDNPGVWCDAGCASRWFLDKNDYDVHLESVHKDIKASVAAARETGRAITEALSRNGSGQVDSSTLLLLVESQQRMLDALLADRTPQAAEPVPAPKTQGRSPAASKE